MRPAATCRYVSDEQEPAANLGANLSATDDQNSLVPDLPRKDQRPATFDFREFRRHSVKGVESESAVAYRAWAYRA